MNEDEYLLKNYAEIEEGVIRRGRRPRLHKIRKPNSIIVLLFIQNNSQFKNIAKTSLLASMLSYLQVCPYPPIFSKQQMSVSELSSCCFCYVFSRYFAQFQLQFLLLKRVKCAPFLFSQPKKLSLVPTVPQPVRTLHFKVKVKILSNLVISNWLW